MSPESMKLVIKIAALHRKVLLDLQGAFKVPGILKPNLG